MASQQQPDRGRRRRTRSARIGPTRRRRRAGRAELVGARGPTARGRWPTSTTSASASTGRSARERAAERARVAAEWLPVVDNLDLALEHAGGRPGAIVEGVRAVRDQALAVLARLGFPRLDDVGEPFDPARHEAVGAVESRRAGRARWWRSSGPATATATTRAAPGRAWSCREGRTDGRSAVTSTRCWGRARRAEPDEIQRAYRKLARTLPPRRQQGPGRRGAVQGDHEAYDVLSDPDTRAPLRRLRARLPPGPRGRRPASTWAARRSRRPGGRAGRRPGAAGASTADRTPSGSTGIGDGSTSRTCSAACSAAAGAGWGPIAGRRPGGRARAHRRGGLPRRPPLDHPAGPDGPRTLEVNDPARGHRRPADPPGRPGRPGHRRAPRRRPLPGRPHRAAPALPARGPRHLRRPAAGAVGGGARRVGRRSTRRAARPRSEVPAGTSSGRRLRLRGRGMPNPSGTPGDLYAEVQIMVPRHAHRRGAPAVRGAGATSRPSTRGGSDDRRPYALARPVAASTSTPSPARPALHPDSCAASSPSGCSTRHATRPASCGSRPAQLAAVARLQRLRAGFALNYAALGLVLDLLDRIAVLEAARARHRSRPRQEARPWT